MYLYPIKNGKLNEKIIQNVGITSFSLEMRGDFAISQEELFLFVDSMLFELHGVFFSIGTVSYKGSTLVSSNSNSSFVNILVNFGFFFFDGFVFFVYLDVYCSRTEKMS